MRACGLLRSAGRARRREAYHAIWHPIIGSYEWPDDRMHYDCDGAPAFVFDMNEPERPNADRAVLATSRKQEENSIELRIRLYSSPNLTSRFVYVLLSAEAEELLRLCGGRRAAFVNIGF